MGTLIAGMIGGGIVTRGKFTAATAIRGFEKKNADTHDNPVLFENHIRQPGLCYLDTRAQLCSPANTCNLYVITICYY